MSSSSLFRILTLLISGFALLLPLRGEAVTLQPLGVEDAVTLPSGKGEFRMGIAYKDDSPLLFQRDGTDRTQLSVPELSLKAGFGKRVELQAKYELLYVNEESTDSSFGTGDLVLGAKIALLQEGLTWPAIGLRIAAKLPNASNNSGRGTNETDLFIDLLATRNFPGFSLYGNLGIAILGDPRGNQDDKLSYALGVAYPLAAQGLVLLASIEGMDLGPDSLNDRGAILGGLQYHIGQAIFDVGLTTGFRSNSEKWGLRAGLSTPFDLPEGW